MALELHITSSVHSDLVLHDIALRALKLAAQPGIADRRGAAAASGHIGAEIWIPGLIPGHRRKLSLI